MYAKRIVNVHLRLKMMFPLDYSTRWMNHLTCTYQAIKFGAHIEHFILVFVKAYAVKATVIYILVYW